MSRQDAYDLTLRGHPPVKARTKNQRSYQKAILENDMVIGLGPAGCGKTFLSACIAVEKLCAGEVKKIIISRPTVCDDGEEIGFLPGSLEKKLEPWTAPIFDVFYERVGIKTTQTKLKEGAINIIPFTFMRGRTFKDAIVLVDEAQNMTLSQAQKLVTRAGEGSKYVISGDLRQSSIKGDNGLALLVDMIEDYELPVPVIEFGNQDIVRSKLCAMWVEAFENE